PRVTRPRKRDAKRPFTGRPVGGAMNDRDPGIVEQTPPDLVGGYTRVARVDHREEAALWWKTRARWHGAGGVGHEPAPPRVLLSHLADALLRRGERNGSRILHKGRRS